MLYTQQGNFWLVVGLAVALMGRRLVRSTGTSYEDINLDAISDGYGMYDLDLISQDLSDWTNEITGEDVIVKTTYGPIRGKRKTFEYNTFFTRE
jgi:hypothetical protein